MKKTLISAAIAAFCLPGMAQADNTFAGLTKAWTYSHASNGITGMLSEIPAFDSTTNSVWVAGVVGVDVLDATTGSLIQHIDTTGWGNINSVAINNGLAAFAIENTVDRTSAGKVVLFDTASRTLAAGTNVISVGALPDMVTFTPNGAKLLVANEATPSTYGLRIGTSVPRVYGPAAVDPAGTVSIIDMGTRSVVATAGLVGVPTSGSNIRVNTGMDFEPEYIAVNAAGTRAYVSLQEANAMGVLDLNTNSFTQVVGLGAKDFSAPGNEIDPLNNSSVAFGSHAAKGLYMPDGMAAYQSSGQTYIVMANEGDFREDDADRSAASTLGAVAPLNNLRVSNTESSSGNLFAAGGRSFSIRDEAGNLVYDSGSILDREAFARGIYDDGRSRDKGVEPEGVEVMAIGGKTYAFIGLERTTTGAVAIFDITDPSQSSFIDMIVTAGDVSPEGLKGFVMGGKHYLAIANEVSNTTTLYSLAPVPEPETYAMLLVGIGLLGVAARRRKQDK